MQYHALILTLFWLFFVAVIAPATAVAQSLSARNMGSFTRITIQHDEGFTLKTTHKGEQIRLSFSQPLSVNAGTLLQAAKPIITSVQQGADTKTLLITTNKPYRIRRFVSKNGSGVDILAAQPIEVAETAETPKPAPSKVVANTPIPVPAAPKAKPEPKPKPAEKPKPDLKPSVISGIMPKPKPTPPKTPEIAAPPTTTPPLKTKPEPELKPEEAPAPENVAMTEEEEEEEEAAPPAEPEAKKAEAGEPTATIASDTILTEPLASGTGIALTFPWQQRVAAAAYRRGDYTVLIFNAYQPFNVDSLTTQPLISEAQGESIPLAQKALMIALKTELQGVRATKSEESYHWQFELSAQPQLPSTPLPLQPRSQPPLKPHLFIPQKETAAPMTINDPIIGDPLQIVPLYRAGHGQSQLREFVEFSLLPSAQGLVVADGSADLRVALTRNGIKITTPEGIILSDDLPPIAPPAAADEKSESNTQTNVFYPQAVWKAPENNDARRFEADLWKQISSGDSQAKLDSRKRLAELYLSQRKHAEARAILEDIARIAPPYFTSNKLHATLGLAYFLTYDYAAAEEMFNHPSIAKVAELGILRNALTIVLKNEGEIDYLTNFPQFIQHYPPALQERLALIAADNQINRQRYNMALKIFDTLDKGKLIETVRDYVDFLIGRVMAETNQKSAAREVWQQLSDTRLGNRFIRARAAFSLINMDLNDNSISLSQAIERLEPLRIIWRGDEFEINLLTLLAGLYEETGNYREALRAKREIVTYFPNYKRNFEITGEMAETFIYLFNQGGAEEMSPLQALALYYEFRNLTPIGAEGDTMIRNLADRLVQVDLLGRAAALLDHQVQYRLSGTQRSRVGAQLALIHLFQHDPKEAIRILELTGYGNNPPDLQDERAILTAKALTELGETERALGLLANNHSREAQLLENSIHWKAKNWPKVIESAEALLGAREDPSQPLTDTENGLLMKLAIAYIFEEQSEPLQYLRDYFLPLVPEGQKREMFGFLSEEMPTDYRRLTELAKQISRMEGFLQTYREKVEEGGLSKAVP